MNKFLVFASVLVCASADIGLKLREGSPTGSYLPQTYGSGSNSYGSYGNGPQTHYSPSGYSGFGNYHGVVPQGSSGYTTYGSAPHTSYSSYGNAPHSTFSSYGSAPQYSSYGGAAPHYGGYSVQQNFAGIPQAVQHHRSFFFDAPEDLGETHVRVHVQPSAAAGDKTIYIRTPAYKSKIVPHFNIQQQQQSAGKTKVIVLVKKPEEQQDIVVPAAVHGPATKPEVVFVKYSNQHEAEQKIQDIQQGASSGDSAKVVFNHRELVSSIKDEPTHHGHHHDISYGPSTVIGGEYGGPSSIGSSGDSITTFPAGNQHHETHYGPAGESGPY